jgi:hypothetical protein
MNLTPTTQNVSYFTINTKGAPSVTFFPSAPTSAQWRGFNIMDEAYVPSTQQWYKLLSLQDNVATWVLQASASANFIDEIVTNSGDVFPIANVVNIVGGTGASTTGSSNTVTINTTGAGLTWTTVTGSTQTIAINNGYFSNDNSGVTFTLPTTCPEGSVFGVTNINSGGFIIAQNASQNMRIGTVVTTTGTSGSFTSTQLGDSVLFVCDVANTSFVAISVLGNLTKA